jgi:hypothetical protein
MQEYMRHIQYQYLYKYGAQVVSDKEKEEDHGMEISEQDSYDLVTFGLTTQEIVWLQSGVAIHDKPNPNSMNTKGFPHNHARQWKRRDARWTRKWVTPTMLDVARRVDASLHSDSGLHGVNGNCGYGGGCVTSATCGNFSFKTHGLYETAAGYRHMCLIQSFQACGVPVPFTRSGPFWALKDTGLLLLVTLKIFSLLVQCISCSRPARAGFTPMTEMGEHLGPTAI